MGLGPGLLGSKGLHRWEFTGHSHHLHPWQKITNGLLKIGFLGSVFQAKVATQDVSSARDCLVGFHKQSLFHKPKPYSVTLRNSTALSFKLGHVCQKMPTSWCKNWCKIIRQPRAANEMPRGSDSNILWLILQNPAERKTLLLVRYCITLMGKPWPKPDLLKNYNYSCNTSSRTTVAGWTSLPNKNS